MTIKPAATFSLSRAPRAKLAETVAQQLADAIRDLPAGTRVPSERELTRALGVGRSTVREALQGLALLGAVEIRHGQGVFVAGGDAPRFAGSEALSAALVKGITQDFFEARLLIETEVIRLAAERRTEADLRALERGLAEQERAMEKDLRSLVEIASRFHLTIAEAAHNEVLEAFEEHFVELMIERGVATFTLIPEIPAWDIVQHRGLYEAIAASDAELAVGRMRAHVLGVAEFHKRAGAL